MPSTMGYPETHLRRGARHLVTAAGCDGAASEVPDTSLRTPRYASLRTRRDRTATPLRARRRGVRQQGGPLLGEGFDQLGAALRVSVQLDGLAVREAEEDRAPEGVTDRCELVDLAGAAVALTVPPREHVLSPLE